MKEFRLDNSWTMIPNGMEERVEYTITDYHFEIFDDDYPFKMHEAEKARVTKETYTTIKKGYMVSSEHNSDNVETFRMSIADARRLYAWLTKEKGFERILVY